MPIILNVLAWLSSLIYALHTVNLRLKELCRQWRNKVEDLSGEGTRLAAMGGPELQLLIRAQKRGVERTTVALKELTILHE